MIISHRCLKNFCTAWPEIQPILQYSITPTQVVIKARHLSPDSEYLYQGLNFVIINSGNEVNVFDIKSSLAYFSFNLNYKFVNQIRGPGDRMQSEAVEKYLKTIYEIQQEG